MSALLGTPQPSSAIAPWQHLEIHHLDLQSLTYLVQSPFRGENSGSAIVSSRHDSIDRCTDKLCFFRDLIFFSSQFPPPLKGLHTKSYKEPNCKRNHHHLRNGEIWSTSSFGAIDKQLVDLFHQQRFQILCEYRHW